MGARVFAIVSTGWVRDAMAAIGEIFFPSIGFAGNSMVPDDRSVSVMCR
jgi:hypothetical protein